LSRLVSFEALKLAAGATILSPFLPLLFMGEEYGEVAPFQYFVSHTDPELVDAVRRGRREEFAAFGWPAEPPDPQAEATFQATRLDHDLKDRDQHRVLWEFYRELLRVRREVGSISLIDSDTREVQVYEKEKVLWVRVSFDGLETVMALNFSNRPAMIAFPGPPGRWEKALDSSEARWLGPGSQLPTSLQAESDLSLTLGPESVILFVRRAEDL
jgi:maltooligosyltrehalose trehalohydrolase